ncbi:hypothetical protein [Pelosinus baikalensis]|uniref:Uncharacterized protein n=1 Tax=Pelosinus baikalensis TaxID=2892015 RepID=A0ABS8HXI7_9FIRM|nr:hypothetical protein [Pelosinus baikalensis]MCC5467865.1 hypothetical protein [Pelosinus baikalensis]
MKKTFITASLLVMNVLGVSMVSANEILPEIDPIKPGIETIVSGSENSRQYTMIDHNPTLYNKQVVGGRTMESWVKNNVVNTAVNGIVTKSYPINGDLETIVSGSKNSRQYTVIDHNPTHYTKKAVGNHTVESWAKDGVVSTRVDGVATKFYRINKDLETIESGSKNSRQYTVIDHNPTHYSKKILGGHTVEGWMENGVVNTRIDGVLSKH